MGTSFAFKPIITNGLVLNLDAANRISFVSGNTSWYDLSGNGNNGTLNGTITFNSNNAGSLSFDGTSGYVLMNNKPSSTQFSITSWVNIDTSNSGYRTIYADNVNGVFLLDKVINYKNIFTGTTTLNTDQWYFISLTYDGATMKSYIDSVLDKTTSVSTTLPTGATTSIGGHDSIEFFNGKISNVQIYNRSLTSTEIQQNYNAIKLRYQ